MLLALAGAIAVTLACVIVAANFSVAEKKVERQVRRLYDACEPAFRRAMGVLLGPSITTGNAIELLVNGDRIYPAMLDAIASARRTICFETFIYWQGRPAVAFADALIERSRAGVAVHVLLDWVGSRPMDEALLKRLTDSGIQVERFHAPRWYQLHRLNNRTHRKLLIIDGCVGFTGGVGIADRWTGDAQDPEHWRDNHFRVEGPVVAQMQSAFLDNWMKARREVLHGDAYFPALEPAGDVDAQMFCSSPTGGAESLHLMYVIAITAAAKSIVLGNAYFVPDRLTRRALIAAAERGVQVRILVPGARIDIEAVRYASRALWGRLLEAGVRIFEYQPTMYHCKLLVIDGCWTAVGSANFDNRSFALNDEANLCCFDPRLAAQLTELFERDLERAREMSLQHWRSRPWLTRTLERAAMLLRSQL